MLNLDKLNSVDLKNIDTAQLNKVISEHRNSFLKLAIIVGSLFVAGVMFNGHRMKDQDLRAKISQMQEKLEALSASDAAIQNLNKFKSSLPKKINENDLITLISDYAKSYNVIIASLSPAESKDMGLYDTVNLSFNAASDNFKDMMLFLRKIEKSEHPLIVNSWTGHEEIDGRITFAIDISAVDIHS